MGGDFLRKVSAGQRMVIPAAAWNEMVDAVKWVREQRGGARFKAPQVNPPILIRNDTGADLTERFPIVRLGAPVFFPDSGDTAAEQATSLISFKNGICLQGETPTADDPFGIVLGPLREDGIGPVMLSGVTPCKVYVTSATEACCTARATAGDATKLTLDCEGTAEVLWRETVTLPGTAWAIVRIGCALPAVTEVVWDDEACEITVTKRECP